LRAAALPALLLLGAGCTDLSPGLASLYLQPDSAIHFPALGDTLQLLVTGTDHEGRSILPSGMRFRTRTPSVAQVDQAGNIWSVGDGTTFVLVQAGGVAESLLVSVAQARDSLVVVTGRSTPLISVPGDAPLPLTCRAFDAAGQLLNHSSTLSTVTGAVTGTSCETAVAHASGHDTLLVQAGPYQAVVPIIVAVLPTVISDPATPLDLDSFPSGTTPWAPSLVARPGGGMDLYVTAYRPAQHQSDGKEGDLHRLTSSDGIHFSYVGIALRHNPVPCSPQGTGIENIAVVPRTDGAGWRMYYAAGSDLCYGWQVFSAVSPDQGDWTEEPGVRISNGNALTPANRETPPWPAGEGMYLQQLESGEWSMLLGAYERIEPRENRFQVIEWRSPDQLAWRYLGPVLTTRQVGPVARRSIYSPTVHEIAPGIMRMFFTGDDLDRPSGTSKIFSAVRAEGTDWQVEGIVLDTPGVNFYYSTLVDDLLVFVRDTGGQPLLGGVRIETR
jgi:hypothetical protein